MKTLIESGTLVIFPEGDIDQHSVGRIRGEADRLLLNTGIRNIAFDMSRTSFMDSAGIGMIIGRCRKVAALGGKIYIRGASPEVLRIIGLSGLGNIVNIEEEHNEQNEA